MIVDPPALGLSSKGIKIEKQESRIQKQYTFYLLSFDDYTYSSSDIS